jgi:hypothetical protein
MQGNLLEKLGPNSSIPREYLGDRRIVLTLLVRLERHRSGVSFLSLSFHMYTHVHLHIRIMFLTICANYDPWLTVGETEFTYATQDRDHGAPESQRRTVGASQYDPTYSSSSHSDTSQSRSFYPSLTSTRSHRRHGCMNGKTLIFTTC